MLSLSVAGNKISIRTGLEHKCIDSGVHDQGRLDPGMQGLLSGT